MKRIETFIDSLQTPVVIKADGLCAGKGVIIATSHKEAKQTAANMLSGESFGDAGTSIVIEEFLDGYELSVFVVCDGKDYKILPVAQDHKRLLNGDKGPNTGGMGAYAPTPLVGKELHQKIIKKIIEPTLKGMKNEGYPFEGVLFIGIMVVKSEPIVLEYNVRFGDPECEILMPLLKSPASELFYKAATKNLKNLNLELSNEYAVCVVMASENYPYKSSKPAEIIINKAVDKEVIDNTHISYAGVTLKDNKLYATGGRVLLCIGLGDTINKARDLAYSRCDDVNFVGKKFRTDIACQVLI
ncbi:MAG: phosphoribosylamine--glycine ligase [Sulfurospirillum sp.]|nr:phosphoribosylamine--glycine ligase [Sulfurospirillum sp.]